MMYEICKIGKEFKNEAKFADQYINEVKKNGKEIMEVLKIENIMESGQPDLLMIDNDRRAIFVELKYERNGHITFEKTQVPWYKKHKNLTLLIIAYRLKDKTMHTMDGDYVIKNIKNGRVKLDV